MRPTVRSHSFITFFALALCVGLPPSHAYAQAGAIPLEAPHSDSAPVEGPFTSSFEDHPMPSTSGAPLRCSGPSTDLRLLRSVRTQIDGDGVIDELQSFGPSTGDVWALVIAQSRGATYRCWNVLYDEARNPNWDNYEWGRPLVVGRFAVLPIVGRSSYWILVGPNGPPVEVREVVPSFGARGGGCCSSDRMTAAPAGPDAVTLTREFASASERTSRLIERHESTVSWSGAQWLQLPWRVVSTGVARR